MLNVETLYKNKTCIDDKWVVARPMLASCTSRIYDAVQILKGKADAVIFYKQ